MKLTIGERFWSLTGDDGNVCFMPNSVVAIDLRRGGESFVRLNVDGVICVDLDNDGITAAEIMAAKFRWDESERERLAEAILSVFAKRGALPARALN